MCAHHFGEKYLKPIMHETHFTRNKRLGGNDTQENCVRALHKRQRRSNLGAA